MWCKKVGKTFEINLLAFVGYCSFPERGYEPTKLLEDGEVGEFFEGGSQSANMALIDIDGSWRCKVEARGEYEITKNENATSVVVTLRLNVSISHQEHGENERNGIPAREDETESLRYFAHVFGIIPG